MTFRSPRSRDDLSEGLILDNGGQMRPYGGTARQVLRSRHSKPCGIQEKCSRVFRQAWPPFIYTALSMPSPNLDARSQYLLQPLIFPKPPSLSDSCLSLGLHRLPLSATLHLHRSLFMPANHQKILCSLSQSESRSERRCLG